MNEKIIFFGTGDFGAAMLDALFKSGYKIELVISQPDRPVGRKQELTPPAVKKMATLLNLKTDQPETLKGYELPFAPDLIVVCQYGIIIPRRILDLGKFGSINIHTSLLPKYRGASPIQSALVNGEQTTGITIMQMDEKMDHGPILNQISLPIEPIDTYPELRQKMTPLAAKLLIDTIPDWISGTIKPKIQDESQATFCKVFTRDDGKINWEQPASQIYNLYRGLNPWPGIWTVWNGKRLKLTKISPSEEIIEPGVVKFSNNKIFIGCGSGSIKIERLQLEGKKELSSAEFVAGHSYLDGKKLG